MYRQVCKLKYIPVPGVANEELYDAFWFDECASSIPEVNAAHVLKILASEDNLFWGNLMHSHTKQIKRSMTQALNINGCHFICD